MSGFSAWFQLICYCIVIVGMSVACLFMAAASWNMRHLRDDAASPRWVRFAYKLGRIR